MHKHIFLTLATCALMAIMATKAHAAYVIEGLCDGQLGDPTEGQSKPGSGTISAATIFPKELLAPYVGMKIVRIRVGLALNEGFTDMRGWVRGSLDADDLATTAFTSPQVGWNEASFDTPVVIPSEQALVFGYSFEQQKSCNCISLAGKDELEGFAPAADGFWLCKNGTWENRSSRYAGSVCVEVVIEDDRLPSKDLAVISASLDKPQVKYGENMKLSFTVRNKAMEEVDDVRYVVSIENKVVAETTRHTLLTNRQEETITCEITSDVVPLGLNHLISIQAHIDGDQKEENNSITTVFSSYDTSYEHKLLIEEFSTEKCSNCPRAIETFAQLMAEGFEEKTVSVLHHVGYGTDWLTVEDDKEYLWFYGIDGTFAPAAMYDRRPFSDYGGTNNNSGMGIVPVTQVAYPDNVRPQLEAALAFPSFVKVEPAITYDASTREMNVTVQLEKMAIFDTQCTQPRLTVFVVEDSILHHNQAGYSSTTFKHRHVCRTHLSDVWGDAIEFIGNKASMCYSITLPEEWDAHYVSIVAFVSNRNENDRNDNVVFNTAHAAVKNLTEGIEMIDAQKEILSVEYYSFDGRRITSTTHPCIKVSHYADGTKKVIRITSLHGCWSK